MSDRKYDAINHYKLSYRPDIDGLRAVSVISVIIFHAFPTLLKGGFVGVDIFFVISGYLISSIIISQLNNADFTFKQFYIRRIKRIFPCLILVLLAVYVVGWLVLFDVEYKQLSKHIVGGASFISNFMLFKESGYFDTSSETKPLLHLWSLAIEEQFYIIWPALLYIAFRTKFNFALVLAISFLLSLMLNVIMINLNTSAAFYMPYTRFWELIIGSIIAYIEHYKGANVKYSNALKTSVFQKYASLIGTALIFISIAMIRKNHMFPGFFAILPTMGTALIIASGPQNPINKLLSNKFIVFIGLISFPLYLWHWPIIAFLNIINGSDQSVLYRLYAVLLTFILAVMTFYFFERPIRFKYGSNIAFVLVFCVILVGLLGAYTSHYKGLPNRMANINYIDAKTVLLRQPHINEPCKEYINSQDPSFHYCMFNNMGSNHTVAIIGDSHAHTAYDGISSVSAKYGFNTVLLSNTGCPSLIGAEYGDNEKERSECRKKTDDIISIITNKDDIKTVLIFTRGTMYTTGKYFGGARNNDFDYIPIPMSVFQKSLADTIETIELAGKTVYYITENPELYNHPFDCISRPIIGWSKSCDVSKIDVKSRHADFFDMLDTLEGRNIISTIDFFCPNDQCISSIDGISLYADYDHLSVLGSEFQASFVEKYIINIRP